jgi:ferredoxin-NADP reductase
MRQGDEIFVSQLSGNFTLNHNKDKKLVFIAGGIGITPFRSMVKYIIDTKKQVDITLIYLVGSSDELAYEELFHEAAPFGVKYVPIVTSPDNGDSYRHANFDGSLIRELVPDGLDRTFYISGPNVMVEAIKHHLKKLGVQRRAIRTDHFSGY